jgi:hypothetical protein
VSTWGDDSASHLVYDGAGHPLPGTCHCLRGVAHTSTGYTAGSTGYRTVLPLSVPPGQPPVFARGGPVLEPDSYSPVSGLRPPRLVAPPRYVELSPMGWRARLAILIGRPVRVRLP